MSLPPVLFVCMMYSSRRFGVSRILVAELSSYNPFSFSLCLLLDGLIFIFSLTVSEAMAAAHSSHFSLQQLTQHPHHLRSDLTVLSSNQKLFIFIPESSCWTRFEGSNRFKGIGSFFDKIFISDSRFVQPSRQGKRFLSFFVQKREPFLDFRLIGLFLF